MINFKYVLLCAVAVLFTWFLHEFGHWLAGEILGNSMAMTLNTGYPVTGKHAHPSDATIISAAGPVVTILQAILFYWLLKRNDHKLLFPFLLTPLYMRFLAGAMSFINLNDESRISKDIGLGPVVLPMIVVAGLLYLVYDTCLTRHYRSKFIWLTVLIIMVVSSCIILTDQALRIRIF